MASLKKTVEPFRFTNFLEENRELEKEMTTLLASCAHHVHPDIVKHIQDANIDFRIQLKNEGVTEILLDQFLFAGSACVFPLFRRPIHSEKEMKNWKNKVFKDGTILNDNTTPRHIWAHLQDGKCYGGTYWKESGLAGFELAHIFSHKVDECSLEKDAFKNFPEGYAPYSMFTCATNVALVPKGIAKPSDKLQSTKLCLFKRNIKLYGEDVLPGLSGFNDSLLPEWYDDLDQKWNDPIQPPNADEKVNLLLKFRAEHIIRKIRKI